jgi:hypothetical protein
LELGAGIGNSVFPLILFLRIEIKKPPTGLHALLEASIGTFWILPPITHSKRLEVRLLG